METLIRTSLVSNMAEMCHLWRRKFKSINSASRKLSNTKNSIQQAIEKVIMIVKEQEKIRERNSNDWGLGM